MPIVRRLAIAAPFLLDDLLGQSPVVCSPGAARVVLRDGLTKGRRLGQADVFSDEDVVDNVPETASELLNDFLGVPCPAIDPTGEYPGDR
jgi:hypothetical protein